MVMWCGSVLLWYDVVVVWYDVVSGGEDTYICSPPDLVLRHRVCPGEVEDPQSQHGRPSCQS